jgi:hypothetical protein
LGRALLPFVWNIGLDYAQTDGGIAADDLRVFGMPGAVFY